jgi:hypothetical protein
MAAGQKDNSTLSLKVSLRRNLLREIEKPVVLESHGGYGAIYERCYAHLVAEGVVFEKDPAKAAVLGRQRPTWAVYEADCVGALAAGVGGHLAVSFFDLDPYGEPWPVVDAIFGSKRPWPERIAVVVNDGLRQNLRIAGGWKVASLEAMTARYGNRALHDHYLEICREMLAEKAAQAGYGLSRWAGYYCGYGQMMTHYAAVLVRTAARSSLM